MEASPGWRQGRPPGRSRGLRLCHYGHGHIAPPPPLSKTHLLGKERALVGATDEWALVRSGHWSGLARSEHWSGFVRSGHLRALWKRIHLGALWKRGNLGVLWGALLRSGLQLQLIRHQQAQGHTRVRLERATDGGLGFPMDGGLRWAANGTLLVRAVDRGL